MSKKHHLNLDTKGSRSVMPKEKLNQKICEVAFGLYKKRNCMPGNELADWLEAEKIVKEKLDLVYENGRIK